MRILLDTTVLIDAARGVPRVLSRLEQRFAALPTRPLISAISLEELRAGMRRGERDVTHGVIEWARVVPVGEEEALIAGAWRREYAALGRTLQQSDALIAACALTQSAVIATANVKDFPMPELVVEHWPSGAEPLGGSKPR